MFHGEMGYNLWTSTNSGRGKRKTVVTNGLLVIVHLSTGQFIMKQSSTVSGDIDKLIPVLKAGKSQWKRFNKLCEMDPDLEIIEFPAKKTEAKAIEARIRKSIADRSYLLIN